MVCRDVRVTFKARSATTKSFALYALQAPTVMRREYSNVTTTG
jgi:hypothetical protein